MTRSEAIATINAKLVALDDEQVRALAEMIVALDEPQTVARALSDRERVLLAEAKADFAAGRSFTLEEGLAIIDARLAARRGSP